MDFELREEGGEVVQCDNCDFPAPTAGFDWGPPLNAEHGRPQRILRDAHTALQVGEFGPALALNARIAMDAADRLLTLAAMWDELVASDQTREAAA